VADRGAAGTFRPGDAPFARRLAALDGAPTQDLAALSALVRDLDAKVRSLRDAEVIRKTDNYWRMWHRHKMPQ
jgi:hypothetical protein